MDKKMIVRIGVVIAIMAFVGYTLVLVLKKDALVLQGEVEAKQVKVASKVPGRIEELGVKKGQQVNIGDFVFSISSPEIDARLAEATAARSAAEAQNRKAENGAQEEDVTAAYSTYVKAEAAAVFAQKTFDRVERLYQEGVVPEQQRDEADTKMKAARETANAAKAVWQKAEKGTRDEDKATARAMVARADAAIAQVEAYINETTINALNNGEVSGIHAEPGELVPTGFPVVTLVDMEDIWVTFYIREDYLSNFKIGTSFMACLPGLQHSTHAFKVSYISPVGDFARWTATKTSGDFDLKTFEVEARPVKKIEGLRPGMTAVVEFER